MARHGAAAVPVEGRRRPPLMPDADLRERARHALPPRAGRRGARRGARRGPPAPSLSLSHEAVAGRRLARAGPACERGAPRERGAA